MGGNNGQIGPLLYQFLEQHARLMLVLAIPGNHLVGRAVPVAQAFEIPAGVADQEHGALVRGEQRPDVSSRMAQERNQDDRTVTEEVVSRRQLVE